jgi:hypothetical protein
LPIVPEPTRPQRQLLFPIVWAISIAWPAHSGVLFARRVKRRQALRGRNLTKG